MMLVVVVGGGVGGRNKGRRNHITLKLPPLHLNFISFSIVSILHNFLYKFLPVALSQLLSAQFSPDESCDCCALILPRGTKRSAPKWRLSQSCTLPPPPLSRLLSWRFGFSVSHSSQLVPTSCLCNFFFSVSKNLFQAGRRGRVKESRRSSGGQAILRREAQK